jgi:hypothetical protein
MHDLLFSGYPPLGRSKSRSSSWDGHSTFRDRWLALAGSAKEIQVCVGYASNDAVAELLDIIPRIEYELSFHLSLGMAKFEGLPRSQFRALKDLQAILESRHMGSVNVVNKWPFHGKVSVFTEPSGLKRAILGSSNLSGITKTVMQYECDIEILDKTSVDKLNSFVTQLRQVASEPLNDRIKIVASRSSALVGIFNVEEISDEELGRVKEVAKKSRIAYRMPLRVGPEQQMSNLNVFFGGERRNAQRTWGRPRPWYEVELIPGREWYRNAPAFPDATVHFRVITDDGYTFEVNSSLDEAWGAQKNFRSSGDLEILGRWIKGRLEASGALTPGDHVTTSTLETYGRDQIELVRLDDDTWYMDFSS